MKNAITRLMVLVLVLMIVVPILSAKKTINNLPKSYKGIPFKDSVYTKGAQQIPGRIECKYFDLGGEGIAYHDKDSINNGSGPYNHQPGHCEPGAEYVAYFRINEGVDLSYTKEKLDFSHPNIFNPERRQGFIGWTSEGEWCNYTVNVKKAGTYKVGLLYSNDQKSFKLAINNILVSEYTVPLKTGSYHKWNYAENLGTITFNKAGINLITLHIGGGMNYGYLEIY
jgi:hypothetical protein